MKHNIGILLYWINHELFKKKSLTAKHSTEAPLIENEFHVTNGWKKSILAQYI